MLTHTDSHSHTQTHTDAHSHTDSHTHTDAHSHTLSHRHRLTQTATHNTYGLLTYMYTLSHKLSQIHVPKEIRLPPPPKTNNPKAGCQHSEIKFKHIKDFWVNTIFNRPTQNMHKLSG